MESTRIEQIWAAPLPCISSTRADSRSWPLFSCAPKGHPGPPWSLISSSRADSGLEGTKVCSSQILGFELHTQLCATPVYAVRVRTKCPYYLDIATLT